MRKINNKTIAIFGVISWAISVAASAQDLEGNYTAPTTLLLLSAVASILFLAFAVMRLWKTDKITAIMFFILSITSAINLGGVMKFIYLITLVWVVCLLWALGKSEQNKQVATLPTSSI